MSDTSADGKKRLPLSRLVWTLSIAPKFNMQGKAGVFITAALVGVAGALVALLFHALVLTVQGALTGHWHGSGAAAFDAMEKWHRVIVPVIGGAASGLVLLFIHRFIPHKSTEYMEAVSLGNGYVPARSSLLRSLSAILAIGSGAAIGREGPLVQSCAVAASSIGRWMRLPVPRLRLIVACGAAAGMAAAFHTPLSGGLFVAEIVIGVLAIDILAPLLVSSCAAYLTVSLVGDNAPLYEVSQVGFHTGVANVFYCIALGVIASFCAAAWLWILKKARLYFNGKRFWLPLRLALAGLFLGLISTQFPDLVGNGANMIEGLMHMDWSASEVAVLLILKVLAVAAFFGAGAVGGVLTPSLTIGTVLGFLFAIVLKKAGVEVEHPVAFALIGMAAFFTTAASAPMTALLIVIEMTLAGNLIFPLIIGVLSSYAVSRALKVKSMYSETLAGGSAGIFKKRLGELTLKDISRKWEQVMGVNAKFSDIARMLLRNPSQPIYVASAKGKYLGTILPEDVLEFAKNKDVEDAVLACDILREDIPTIAPKEKLTIALELFSQKGSRDSMPLVEPRTGNIEGILNKTDLYLTLAEMLRRENVK